MNRSEIFYFEILRGIDNYLRTAILNSNGRLAYPADGAGKCENAAKELQEQLPKYIEAQAKALIELYRT